MEVRIEKVEPMRVAFMRNTGPYETCGKAWGTLCAWAGPKGLPGPELKFIGVSHDNPDTIPPEQLRYDACIPVGLDVQPSGQVDVKTIAGGQYAVTTHRGLGPQPTG